MTLDPARRTDPPAELSPRRRYVILAICCMSLFVVGIDVSGVNVAVPSIGTDLHASSTQLQWILDAYTVVLASLLMLAGSTADRVGRRRVFQIGLAVFGIGSLLCSVATSPGLLIAARMLQGIGGSMLNPVAMSIITNTFREPRERARAIGMWGAVVGLSMALGPVIGGVLVDAFSWRAIFWLNIPVVIAALALTALFVPESRAETARRYDPVAQVLMIVMLATITFAIIEGRPRGWGSPLVVGCFVVAGAALVAVVGYEQRRHEPLLDPRFFRSVPFSGAVVSAILAFCAMGGFLFLNTLYLQDVRGMSPLEAGLMTLPMAVATAALSPVSGRVVGSWGPRVPMVVGGVGIAASALLLLRLQPDTPLWYLGIAYALFGIGFGCLNAPITAAAVAGMPRAQAGVAAAIASTSRQVGATLGVAVLPAVAFAHSSGGLAGNTHPAWLVMLGLGVGLIVVGVVVTSAGAIRSRERVAAMLGAD